MCVCEHRIYSLLWEQSCCMRYFCQTRRLRSSYCCTVRTLAWHMSAVLLHGHRQTHSSKATAVQPRTTNSIDREHCELCLPKPIAVPFLLSSGWGNILSNDVSFVPNSNDFEKENSATLLGVSWAFAHPM